MTEIRAGTAPANHLHAVPLLLDRGWEVVTLDLTAQETRSALAFQRRIFRERSRYDIVLAHNYYDVRGLALLRYLGVFRRPLVSFVHSLRLKPWDYVALLGCDLLLPLSQIGQSMLLEAGVMASRLHYFPYGADTRFFHPQVWPGTDKIVLSVGVSGRDFSTLIAAARNITAEVHIVGRVDPSDVAHAPANVRFHSTGTYDMPFAELTCLFARAGCVVISHHGTAHPYGLNAVVEAMAHARPVVLTEGKGIDIDPERLGVGLWAPSHSPEKLAAAVNQLMADGRAAECMGKTAARLVSERLNTDAMAEILDRSLNRLTG